MDYSLADGRDTNLGLFGYKSRTFWVQNENLLMTLFWRCFHMTLGTFTKAIMDAELQCGTQENITLALIKRAGYINKKDDDISESTLKKWNNGGRKFNAHNYFPCRECVKIQEVNNFFRRRPEDRLKKLQQIFFEIIDEYSPIDCETQNMDIFCWSLVNQFLDLLGFEREDLSYLYNKESGNFEEEDNKVDVIENTSDETEGKSITRNGEQPEHILAFFVRSIKEFGIKEFLDVAPMESVRSFRIEDTINFIGRMKTVQDGNTDMIFAMDEAVYGSIIKFTEILLEYVKYLKNQMREEVFNNQPRYCVYDRSDEFKCKTDNYRQQLIKLVGELDGEFKVFSADRLDRLRASQREMLNENTQTGFV